MRFVQSWENPIILRPNERFKKISRYKKHEFIPKSLHTTVLLLFRL